MTATAPSAHPASSPSRTRRSPPAAAPPCTAPAMPMRRCGAHPPIASWRRPTACRFLHHAAMEPINATAQLKDGRLTVWAGEQDALGSKARAGQMDRARRRRREVRALPVGGSFGRRMAQAAGHLEQAARIAMAMAPHPVKMIWSREEDFAQGTYRPALTTAMRAALGPDGRPYRLVAALRRQPRRRSQRGLHHPLRSSPTSRSAPSPAQSHVRVGTWRSVAHSQHGFYTESFIDELAHAAGQRSVRLPPRSPPRRLAPPPRPGDRRREGRLGRGPCRPASAAASPWSRASAPSWPTSSRPRSDRAASRGSTGSRPRSIAATSATPTPRRPRSKAPSSWGSARPSPRRSPSTPAPWCSAASPTIPF